MFYKVKRKPNESFNPNPVFIAEFGFDGENVIIATDDDCIYEASDITTILEASSSIGGYPYIKIIYNGCKYGVQIIPHNDFIGKHPSGRLKFSNGKNKGVATRMVDISQSITRGCVSIYYDEGDSFTDSKNFTEECKNACIGYVYYQINDIESLLNNVIDYQEMQSRTNAGYNSLTQRDKEAYAKMAFKAGSG